MNERDMEYLGNINTSPGPNAGRSIDPTKPGPDANHIAELEREIARFELARTQAKHESRSFIFGGALKSLRATLSRLRNEPNATALAQSDAEPLREVYDKVKGHAVTQSEK